MTGWNRRSSAASDSMYLRYSSNVVAPMHCKSPRASSGLIIELKSSEPSAAPAPTSVCNSSMKRITSRAAAPDFVQNLLDAAFEFAAVLRARDERTEREREHAFVAQRLRNVARRRCVAPNLRRSRSCRRRVPRPTRDCSCCAARESKRRVRLPSSRPMTGSSLPLRARSVRSRENAASVGVAPRSRRVKSSSGLFWPRSLIRSSKNALPAKSAAAVSAAPT